MPRMYFRIAALVMQALMRDERFLSIPVFSPDTARRRRPQQVDGEKFGLSVIHERWCLAGFPDVQDSVTAAADKGEFPHPEVNANSGQGIISLKRFRFK